MAGDVGTDSVHDLVAYSLFDLDPKARQLRAPLLFYIVQLALLTADGPFDTGRLHSVVCERLVAADAITEPDVAKAVAIGVQNGSVIEVESGAWALAPARRQQLQTAREEVEQHGAAFHEHMRVAVELRLHEQLQPEALVEFRQALDEELQGLFAQHTARLVDALREGGPGFDVTLGSMSRKAISKLAQPLARPTEKLRRSQVQAGIRDGLETLPDEARSYLAAVYQRTVVMALMAQDPSIRRVRRDLAAQRVALLDTNVVIAWLFEDHKNHDEARTVIETAKAVGCTLMVSHFTQQELQHQIDAAERVFAGLATSEVFQGLVDNDIVRTYAQRRARNTRLTWGGFMGAYNPPAVALADHGILLTDPEWSTTHMDERIAVVESAVAQAKMKPAGSIVRCDARNMLHVQRLRDQHPADVMGSRVWLVTLDRSLAAADTLLLERGVFDLPTTHLARDWCELLTPLVAPDEQGLKEYVSFLVRSQYGLLSRDPAFVDARFLERLHEARFDIGTLLDGSPERARQTLIRLQRDTEVNRLLKLADGDGDSETYQARLDAAVRTALGATGEIKVADPADELRRERDAALALARAVREQVDELAREVEALRATASSVEVRELKNNWWTRIRAFLRKL